MDLQVFGNSVLGELGSDLLRHGSGLVTVNMMRGVNVSQLLKMDNILWSPSHRGIMFKSTCITDEEKDEEKDEADEEKDADPLVAAALHEKEREPEKQDDSADALADALSKVTIH